MRLLHAATLTGAVVLLASVAAAQGIGEAAAKEKQKRKASTKTAKVYTDDSIGRSMAPVTSSELPATAADAAAKGTAQATGDKPAGAEGAAAEKPAEDPRVKAEAEWHQKLDQARKEEASYQEVVSKLQLALNDTSGLYSSGRAANVQMLEENQKKLADVKTRIAGLEEEGRRNSYR
jgi:hypothetical protein